MSVLRTERAGWVLTATLDDPPTRNALSDAMVAALEALLDATEPDRGVRAIVLRGAGGSFCAGADLRAGSGTPEEATARNTRGGRLFARLAAHPAVTVAVVDGAAFGGGFGLACCADIVLAGPDARFALSETSLGLVPAQIAPHVVARVGLVAARKLALTAARLDGAAAAAIGLADSAHDNRDAVEAALATLLEGVGRCAPEANAATKRLLAEAAAGRPDFIAHAAQVFARAMTGAEAREGIAAFVARRKPRWAE